MIRKLSGPRAPSPKAIAAEKKTASTKQAVKASPAKPKPAMDEKFPRASWKDSARLGAEINRSLRASDEHPRLRHAQSRPDPIGGNDTSRPPIAMRYGVIRPEPGPAPRPPIAMRYGVIRPGPDPVKPPPIAMRYGVIRPHVEPKRR
ncbi:MAG: hypothetical protein H6Q89_4701 [Myxococcaceae bacterium]|nr:hypothetical protein [Myxococcaceae bacterium]